LECEITLAEHNAVERGGQILTQVDSPKVYLLEVARGKSSMLIKNPQTATLLIVFGI